MNYFYKVGPSSINYDSTDKTIVLRDEHARVNLAQAPFEQIIRAWKDGTPTCWNARGCAPGWRLYDEGIIVEYYDEDLLTDIWLPVDDFEEIIQAYEKFTKVRPRTEPYGRMSSDGGLVWGPAQLYCPRSIMECICHIPHNFTEVKIDNWEFTRYGEEVRVYRPNIAFMLSAEQFFATLDYWRKETQN